MFLSCQCFECNVIVIFWFWCMCQVALGNSLEDFNHDEEDHHDEDVHSLKVLGKMAPDPDFDIVLPYGESWLQWDFCHTLSYCNGCDMFFWWCSLEWLQHHFALWRVILMSDTVFHICLTVLILMTQHHFALWWVFTPNKCRCFFFFSEGPWWWWQCWWQKDLSQVLQR